MKTEIMDDFDIYDDLDEEAKDSEQVSELKKKNEDLESQLKFLENELEKSKNSKCKLEINLSSLLQTAKAEIKRKDRMIAELREMVDQMSFRRNINVPPPNHVQSNPGPSKNPPKAANTFIKEKSLNKPATTKSYFDNDEEDKEQIYDPSNKVTTLYGRRLKEKLEKEMEAEKQLKRKLQEEKMPDKKDKKEDIKVRVEERRIQVPDMNEPKPTRMPEFLTDYRRNSQKDVKRPDENVEKEETKARVEFSRIEVPDINEPKPTRMPELLDNRRNFQKEGRKPDERVRREETKTKVNNSRVKVSDMNEPKPIRMSEFPADNRRNPHKEVKNNRTELYNKELPPIVNSEHFCPKEIDLEYSDKFRSKRYKSDDYNLKKEDKREDKRERIDQSKSRTLTRSSEREKRSYQSRKRSPIRFVQDYKEKDDNRNSYRRSNPVRNVRDERRSNFRRSPSNPYDINRKRREDLRQELTTRRRKLSDDSPVNKKQARRGPRTPSVSPQRVVEKSPSPRRSIKKPITFKEDREAKVVIELMKFAPPLPPEPPAKDVPPLPPEPSALLELPEPVKLPVKLTMANLIKNSLKTELESMAESDLTDLKVTLEVLKPKSSVGSVSLGLEALSEVPSSSSSILPEPKLKPSADFSSSSTLPEPKSKSSVKPTDSVSSELKTSSSISEETSAPSKSSAKSTDSTSADLKNSSSTSVKKSASSSVSHETKSVPSKSPIKSTDSTSSELKEASLILEKKSVPSMSPVQPTDSASSDLKESVEASNELTLSALSEPKSVKLTDVGSNDSKEPTSSTAAEESASDFKVPMSSTAEVNPAVLKSPERSKSLIRRRRRPLSDSTPVKSDSSLQTSTDGDSSANETFEDKEKVEESKKNTDENETVSESVKIEDKEVKTLTVKVKTANTVLQISKFRRKRGVLSDSLH